MPYKDKIKKILLETDLKDNVEYSTEKKSTEELNIEIDNGLRYSIRENEIIQKFLYFTKEQLILDVMPKIHFLYKRKNGMTYGAFNPTTKEIDVYAKNRGLADVIRTTAHEIIHFKQKIDGKIPENLQHRDHNLEGEANTKAGDIVYMFGLENPQIYELGDFNSDEIEVPIN